MRHFARQDPAQGEFTETLRAAYPVIYARLASRYRDPQLAEEVTWDSLTRAFEVWRENPHYFDCRSLTEWSSQLAGWRAVDRLRKRTRTVSLVGDPYDDEQPNRTNRQVASHPHDSTVREAQRKMVWDSLQQLDAEDRDLLCASYYDGRSDQNIGAELYGEGSDTARGLRVWRRRQKAQARLREVLIEGGFEDQSTEALSTQAV